MSLSEQPLERTPTQQRAAMRNAADRLELWRIRGQAARAARQPRTVPAFQRPMTASARDQASAAWLAGYDGKGVLR